MIYQKPQLEEIKLSCAYGEGESLPSDFCAAPDLAPSYIAVIDADDVDNVVVNP